MQLATSERESASENLQTVFEIAQSKGRQSAILTASRPGTSAAEEQRDNAILRRELRNVGLPYWLLFGEWREQPDLPTGDWRRLVFVDGTGSENFSVVVRQLMKRHHQPSALLCTNGQASIIRNAGEATAHGQLDIQSSVAAYGRSLSGTGTLTLVRAFVPVGVFGATVKACRGEPDVPRGGKLKNCRG